MKSVILSFFVICVAIALGQVVVSPVPATCAILDNTWALWDVKSTYYNSSDSGGAMAANLCLDMEKSCAHTTDEPCSVCQFRDENQPTAHSYCIGYSKNEVYKPLNQTVYPGRSGFRATLTGDNDWCPGGAARITNIDVLCNSAINNLSFVNEVPICTYNFQLFQTSSCSVSNASFTPTFTVNMITPNSFFVLIDDGYTYEYWNYNVKLNGKVAYQGNLREVFIENLDSATSYQVVVERVSGDGAIMPVVAPSVSLTVQTLPSISPCSINNGGCDIHSRCHYSGNVVTCGPCPEGFTGNGTTCTAAASPNPTVSGTGYGVIIGLVVAAALGGLVFGFLKLRETEWWANTIGGTGGRSSKGFSLMDAEKSNAFE